VESQTGRQGITADGGRASLSLRSLAGLLVPVAVYF